MASGEFKKVDLVRPGYYSRPVAHVNEAEAYNHKYDAWKRRVAARIAQNPEAARHELAARVSAMAAEGQGFTGISFAAEADARKYVDIMKQDSYGRGQLLASMHEARKKRQLQSVTFVASRPVHDFEYVYHPHEGSRYPERYEPYNTPLCSVGKDGLLYTYPIGNDSYSVRIGDGSLAALEQDGGFEDLYRVLCTDIDDAGAAAITLAKHGA